MGNTNHTISRQVPSSKNRLVAKIELDNGISFSVNESSLPIIIGRGADCDICVPAIDVSRQHCELHLEKSVLCIRDKSTNGTLVGGTLIRNESAAIQGRTSIMLGTDMKLTIMPFAISRVVKDERRSSADRRNEERRVASRRSNVVAVDFERREAPRRNSPRRVGSRR